MQRFIKLFVIFILAGFLIQLVKMPFLAWSQELINPQPRQTECLWEICSVDTMKLSRDKARQELDHPEFDQIIAQEMKQIKQTGANYVSIGTPYDKEFLPFLRRWVKAARAEDLKVYFRGNWSSWEGWFEYPKNMTPIEHLIKTNQFLADNLNLFQSGDIFDPCPECENAQFWPQPDKNNDYQQFLLTQQAQTEVQFEKLGLEVKVRPSIIGGRAKEVLGQDTLNRLGNQVNIDHYVPTSKGMSEYIDYFSQHQTKTFVSEFGAPIPDMNGEMSQTQQADFVRSILETLYLKNGNVMGLNYWVASHGTTELINEDGTPRKVYAVLKEYFTPQIVTGRIIDELDKPLSGIRIKTSDGIQTLSDENGLYKLKFPIRKLDLTIEGDIYATQTAQIAQGEMGSSTIQNFTLKPTDPSLIYRLNLWWKQTF